LSEGDSFTGEAARLQSRQSLTAMVIKGFGRIRLRIETARATRIPARVAWIPDRRTPSQKRITKAA
jgi:hypothetical protein